MKIVNPIHIKSVKNHKQYILEAIDGIIIEQNHNNSLGYQIIKQTHTQPCTSRTTLKLH